jgi:hypothetical protein
MPWSSTTNSRVVENPKVGFPVSGVLSEMLVCAISLLDRLEEHVLNGYSIIALVDVWSGDRVDTIMKRCL